MEKSDRHGLQVRAGEHHYFSPSLHSPPSPPPFVIANAVKQSRHRPYTPGRLSGGRLCLDCFVVPPLNDEFPCPRHCERSEAIQAQAV
ncbi:MAG: hypothetical protein LBJ47_08235 [Tannerella sp.]|nr:hypothetical protein [Tannerella sp.]